MKPISIRSDYFATLDWQHHGQRAQTRVRGEFDQQDIVNSEQPDVGSRRRRPRRAGHRRFGFACSSTTAAVARCLRPSVYFECLAAKRVAVWRRLYRRDFRAAGGECARRLSPSPTWSRACRRRVNETSSLITRLRGARYDIETQEVTNAYGAELAMEPAHGARTRAATFARRRAERRIAERQIGDRLDCRRWVSSIPGGPQRTVRGSRRATWGRHRPAR